MIFFSLDAYRGGRWTYLGWMVCTRDDAMAMLAAIPRTTFTPKWRAVSMRLAIPDEPRSVPAWLDSKIR